MKLELGWNRVDDEEPTRPGVLRQGTGPASWAGLQCVGPEGKSRTLQVTSLPWAYPASLHTPEPSSAGLSPIHHPLEGMKLGPNKITEKG